MLHDDSWASAPELQPDHGRHASSGGAIALGCILLVCAMLVGMTVGLIGYGLWRLVS